MLLGANVGFLSIGSVDQYNSGPGGGFDPKSMAQVASYVSMITSLACFVTGHWLTMQHCRENHSTDGQDPVSGLLTLLHGMNVYLLFQHDVEYLTRTGQLGFTANRLSIIYR